MNPFAKLAISEIMKYAFSKKNMKSPTTAASALVVGGTVAANQSMPSDSLETLIMNVLAAIVALVLFFRDSKNADTNDDS